MRWLAFFVGLIITAIGLLGVAAPAVLLALVRLAQLAAGLYVVAAMRVAFGLVLIAAAATSRLPRTLRILGAFIVLAGIVTPIFGVDRTRAIIDWWAAQGVTFMRSWAVFAVLFGLFILYAVTPPRARASSKT